MGMHDIGFHGVDQRGHVEDCFAIPDRPDGMGKVRDYVAAYPQPSNGFSEIARFTYRDHGVQEVFKSAKQVENMNLGPAQVSFRN
jgi:hypothetical protein